MRCRELMWCWCAWGRVGWSTGYGCCRVGNVGTGCSAVSLGFLHTGVDVEMEARDREHLSLPGHQLQLLQDAVRAGRALHVVHG